MSRLPPGAFAAALAGLGPLNHRRLAGLLDRHPPDQAWAAILGEHDDPVIDRWIARRPELRGELRRLAGDRPPERVWEACAATGTKVLTRHDPCYPPLLAADPEAPAVLFVRGNIEALGERRVGMVGTRNATNSGTRLAHRFGRELAGTGVCVVSGLARGIDGAAHRGALEVAGHPASAAPVAVVGSGPDVVFPREHRALWDAVVAHGALLSEHPPGSPPLPDWFPARNRIIAALSEVLLVVESRARGGSLITARQALDRQVPVMAVPGSLLNRAAEGTNRLIADGATPVLEPLDVLVALGLSTGRPTDHRVEVRRPPSASDRQVLTAFGADPLTLDQVALRCGGPIAEVALAVGRLEANGWLIASGGWFEPVAPLIGRERSDG